jgi:hypothetical protein
LLTLFSSIFVEANAAKALAEAEALEQEQAMHEWKGWLSVKKSAYIDLSSLRKAFKLTSL